MPIQRTQIGGPYKGIITDVPPTAVPNGFEDSVNFIGWKGRQRTRPGLDLANKFTSPDGTTILNMTSFEDIENFFHTLALTANNAYMLTAGPVLNLLTYPANYIATVVIDDGGINYVVDDVINIIQAGANGGTATVSEVDLTTGAITGLFLDTTGFDYTPASGLATSGGTGTGATVTITTGSLTSLGGINSTGLPYAVLKAQNRVYFCNGSVPLCYVDGESSFKISGNVPGACRFLTSNAGHLIGAVWSEPDPTQNGSILFPRRIRWSDSGNYDQWNDSDTNSDAGADDVDDTPDVLSGLTTLGTNSYAYRTNGISILTPTGLAAEPFYIRNFSSSPKGEGCPYPYSLTTHNNIDRFIGNYDVWSFDGTSFTPLMDGKCNGKFFSDLSNAVGIVRGFVTILLDNGFPFLGYVITIPGANVAWALNIAEGSWNRMMWAPPSGAISGTYDLQFIEQVYLS